MTSVLLVVVAVCARSRSSPFATIPLVYPCQSPASVVSIFGLKTDDSKTGRKGSLIVSLHDVSPHTWKECVAILAELKTLGVSRTSLLVIPNHHERGHFLDYPEFCDWLKESVAAGHEVVMHGYTHRDRIQSRETLLDTLTTRFYTAGEGEFHSISQEEAKAWVAKSLEEFAQIGLSPGGFIAPAWLLGTEAEEALRDLGVDYTTRIGGILDLKANRFHPSQSLCWSVRAAWRRWTSLVWNAFLFHRLENAPLLRIAIHPVDIAHPKIWGQIRGIITKALRSRTTTVYADIIKV